MRRLRQKSVVGSLLVLAGLALVALAPSARAEGPLVDSSLLAPRLADLDSALKRLETLLADSQALAASLYRIHNNVAANRVAETRTPSCRDNAWIVDLGARSRAIGPVLRDVLQSARAQAHRVEVMLQEPTVEPLADATVTFRTAEAFARVRRLEVGYREMRAWQKSYVEPLLGGCDVTLAAAPGLTRPGPEAQPPEYALDDPAWARSGRVAVVTAGKGWVCPQRIATPGVAVLEPAQACWSPDDQCTCDPEPVLPAAVLGPAAEASEIPQATEASSAASDGSAE
jgi:hypothetical protein